jgi:hypothetical protein
MAEFYASHTNKPRQGQGEMKMNRTYIIRRIDDHTTTSDAGVIQPERSHAPIARTVAASREAAETAASAAFPGVQIDLSCPSENKLHLFAELPTV